MVGFSIHIFNWLPFIEMVENSFLLMLYLERLSFKVALSFITLSMLPSAVIKEYIGGISEVEKVLIK